MPMSQSFRRDVAASRRDFLPIPEFHTPPEVYKPLTAQDRARKYLDLEKELSDAIDKKTWETFFNDVEMKALIAVSGRNRLILLLAQFEPFHSYIQLRDPAYLIARFAEILSNYMRNFEMIDFSYSEVDILDGSQLCAAIEQSSTKVHELVYQLEERVLESERIQSMYIDLEKEYDKMIEELEGRARQLLIELRKHPSNAPLDAKIMKSADYLCKIGRNLRIRSEEDLSAESIRKHDLSQEIEKLTDEQSAIQQESLFEFSAVAQDEPTEADLFKQLRKRITKELMSWTGQRKEAVNNLVHSWMKEINEVFAQKGPTILSLMQRVPVIDTQLANMLAITSAQDMEVMQLEEDIEATYQDSSTKSEDIGRLEVELQNMSEELMDLDAELSQIRTQIKRAIEKFSVSPIRPVRARRPVTPESSSSPKFFPPRESSPRHVRTSSPYEKPFPLDNDIDNHPFEEAFHESPVSSRVREFQASSPYGASQPPTKKSFAVSPVTTRDRAFGAASPHSLQRAYYESPVPSRDISSAAASLYRFEEAYNEYPISFSGGEFDESSTSDSFPLMGRRRLHSPDFFVDSSVDDSTPSAIERAFIGSP